MSRPYVRRTGLGDLRSPVNTVDTPDVEVTGRESGICVMDREKRAEVYSAHDAAEVTSATPGV